jgi:hypothetical protein
VEAQETPAAGCHFDSDRGRPGYLRGARGIQAIRDQAVSGFSLRILYRWTDRVNNLYDAAVFVPVIGEISLEDHRPAMLVERAPLSDFDEGGESPHSGNWTTRILQGDFE